MSKNFQKTIQLTYCRNGHNALFFLFNSNYHYKDRSGKVKNLRRHKNDFKVKFLLLGVFDFTYELQITKKLKKFFEKHKASQKPFCQGRLI